MATSQEYLELAPALRHLSNPDTIEQLKQSGDYMRVYDPFVNDIMSQPDDISRLHSYNRAIAMTGGGFGSWLQSKISTPLKQLKKMAHNFVTGKSVTTKRLNWPPKVRKILDDDGHQGVTGVTICRTPIQKGLEVVLDMIMQGRWSNMKSNLEYDKVYHLFLLVELGNGRTVLVEKNAVISANYYNGTPEPMDSMDVPVMVQGFTFGEMMKNGEAATTPEKFFVYNPFNANCQYFVNDILTANQNKGLLEYTEADRSFVLQDCTAIAGELPESARFLMTGTTNLAHTMDYIMNGEGFESRAAVHATGGWVPAVRATGGDLEEHHKNLEISKRLLEPFLGCGDNTNETNIRTLERAPNASLQTLHKYIQTHHQLGSVGDHPRANFTKAHLAYLANSGDVQEFKHRMTILTHETGKHEKNQLTGGSWFSDAWDWVDDNIVQPVWNAIGKPIWDTVGSPLWEASKSVADHAKDAVDEFAPFLKPVLDEGIGHVTGALGDAVGSVLGSNVGSVVGNVAMGALM